MELNYFDAKRELKKIYELGLKAIKRNDNKYINFLLFNLEELKDNLKNKFVIDTFGIYLLNKEIKQIHMFLTNKINN